jgi:tetratricopeptide (TPR) repeat protein/DNA-binding CsgD family transcriptional regulator
MKNFLLIVSAIVFIFLSCNEKRQDQENEFIDQGLEFNASNAVLEYHLLNDDEKIDYLTDLVKKSYINSSELDSWMLEIIKKDPELLKNVSIKSLTEFTYQINQNKTSKINQFVAQFIFDNKEIEKYKSLQSIAVKTILDELQTKSYKDSIKYYLDYYKKALAYDKNPRLYYDYNLKLSAYNQMNGDVFKAILNLDHALTYLSENDNKDKSILYNNLALLYKILKHYEKAEYFIEKAISLVKEEDIQLNTLNTLASIKMRLNKLEESEKVYLKIIEKNKIEKDQATLARVYTNLGNVSRRKKEFDKSLEYYKLSDSICDITGIDLGKYINQLNRSEVYMDMGKYDEAEESILVAKDKSEVFDIPTYTVELNRLLSEIFLKLNKSALSDKYFRLYIEEKEKLSGDQTKTLITEWELAKEREINQAQNSKITLKLERQKNQIYLISLLLAIVLVSGIAFYLFQKKKMYERQANLEKEKQRMAYDLELKSKTLLADSLKNITINNTKESIYTQLKEIINELPPTHQSKFSKILLDLKSKTNNSFLDEFETRFTGVYEEFFEKLNRLGPEITPTELKICALMRLNLSTKEIAVLTNRTIGTIDNIRSSIRKKLKIDEQESLQHFLMDL